MKTRNAKSTANLNTSVAGADVSAFQDKLDQSILREQDRDIEIERLQTTCVTLNAKSQINDDLHSEIEILRRRLQENEEQLRIANEENASLR
jgi:hypothetical protein